MYRCGSRFYVLGTGWILCTGYGSGFYVLGTGLDFIYWLRVWILYWILCTGYGTEFYVLDTVPDFMY